MSWIVIEAMFFYCMTEPRKPKTNRTKTKTTLRVLKMSRVGDNNFRATAYLSQPFSRRTRGRNNESSRHSVSSLVPGLECAHCHVQSRHEPVRGHICLLQVRAETLGKSSQLAGGGTKIHTVGEEPARTCGWTADWTVGGKEQE